MTQCSFRRRGFDAEQFKSDAKELHLKPPFFSDGCRRRVSFGDQPTRYGDGQHPGKDQDDLS